MRIGLVCPYNLFRPGGVQSLILEIADDLKAKGHYVRIIAPKPSPKTNNDTYKLDRDDIILIGGSKEFNTPFATKGDIGFSGSNEKIDELLAEHNFDVLHLHEPGVPALGLQILSRSTCANVATMHATLPEDVFSKSYQKIMKPIAKFFETKIDVITAVSEVAAASAAQYLPNSQITIVPNGIRTKSFSKSKNDKKNNSKSKTILYVGRLEKRKGVKYLLKAYAQLRQRHDNIKLVIVGNGDLRESLESKISKNNIPDVSFTGFIPEVEKIDLLQKADIYCSPALYGESFGIVLLEAMAAGTVVVAGNNPGYASVMKGRGKLSLVNPQSIDDFTDRLELLLFDKDIRHLWENWAKKEIKLYDYAVVVEKYEDIYEQAVKIFKSVDSRLKTKSNKV